MNLGQFSGLPGSASNVVAGNVTAYTRGMFLKDFPQFAKRKEGGGASHVSLIPHPALSQFIAMANGAIQEARWFEKWRWAMGLYVAHYAVLYLSGYADGSANVTAAANSGAALGLVESADLGNASVSYDTKSVAAATEKWGALNATTYGQLLATEARLVGMGGSFIM
jgi:hypothetical protein